MSDRPIRQAEGPLRSYGRRTARPLRAGRQRALDQLLPSLGIALPDPGQQLDPTRLFGSTPRQVWLEIGFGGGEHLVAQAQANAHVGLIGCDPFIDGVARLLAQVERHGLTNIRLFPDDARGLLDALPTASIARLFLLFPDPWPKARHHKRRLLQPRFLDQVARVLRDGGDFRFASDHVDYMTSALQHLTNDNRFLWQARSADDWRQRPADWPPTRYETKALARGAQCTYLDFQRQPRPDHPSTTKILDSRSPSGI